MAKTLALPAHACTVMLCLGCVCAPALAAPETYSVAAGPAQSARFAASTQTEHYGGHTDQVSGTLVFDALAPAQTSARFSILLSSLSTGNSLRDSNMRRFVLQTGLFPTADFRLTRITLPASRLLPGQSVRVLAEGTLTLHGVTRPVAAPVDVTREAGAAGQPALHLATRFVVRLDDYHIHAPRFLFFVVRQEHVLSADMHAVMAVRRERLPAAARNKS